MSVKLFRPIRASQPSQSTQMGLFGELLMLILYVAFFLYPIFWILWEILYAALRLFLGICNLIVFIFSNRFSCGALYGITFFSGLSSCSEHLKRFCCILHSLQSSPTKFIGMDRQEFKDQCTGEQIPAHYLPFESQHLSICTIWPLPGYAPTTEYNLVFIDQYQFLMLSQGSLDELNSQLEEPLPINHFRPRYP
ncbi:hypothetical protein ACET3Z_026574 [Daucus carota]